MVSIEHNRQEVGFQFLFLLSPEVEVPVEYKNEVYVRVYIPKVSIELSKQKFITNFLVPLILPSFGSQRCCWGKYTTARLFLYDAATLFCISNLDENRNDWKLLGTLLGRKIVGARDNDTLSAFPMLLLVFRMYRNFVHQRR